MQTDLVSAIREELKQQADERTIGISQSFFKETVSFYGVKTSLVNQIARQSFSAIKQLGKDEILRLAEELAKSDYNEEAFIAFDWAYRVREDFQVSDFDLFERWLVQYVNNWAKCDTLCNHAVGALVMRYPDLAAGLKRWTQSETRWLRRAAAVSLISPAKKGLFLKDIFDIADLLLVDSDDLVQKGYGWMLKAASQEHRQEVFTYVMQNKKTMPRTALRYAIEKLPADLRQQAMEKPD